MKISYSWLKKYIKIDLTAERIATILTDIGLEVESITSFPEASVDLSKILIGEILTAEKAPNSDKLKLCNVKIGADTLQIVCGAPNARQGIKVPVATIGAKVLSKDKEIFEIKKSKIRGHESFGMLCSEVELGLGSDNSGLMELDNSLVSGTALDKIYQITPDQVFEIGLTPNRSDAMGHFGVARDLAAYLNSHNLPAKLELGIQKFPINSVEEIQIDNSSPKLVPRFSVFKLNNIQVGESPRWVKDALLAIGIEPKNNVVDATNYVMHAIGQPIHAYDAKYFNENKIFVGVSEHPTQIELLGNVIKESDTTDILIKNKENHFMGLAGILGGISSSVTDNTEEILVESAYFDPVSIRKTAKRLGLHTDASFRFERGCDPEITLSALHLATQIISETCENVQILASADAYPAKSPASYIVLRFSKLDQVSGIKIHREEVKEILRHLDIKVINEIQNGLEIEVPRYRADVLREIDVIEEIMRIYGFNKIKSTQKIAYTPLVQYPNQADTQFFALENKLRFSLVALGCTEVMNNSLQKSTGSESQILLKNPLSKELSGMRENLESSLAQSVSFNEKRSISTVKFFEIGNVYAYMHSSIIEECHIGIILGGSAKNKSWIDAGNSSDFLQLKSKADDLFNTWLPNIPLEQSTDGKKLEYSFAGMRIGEIYNFDAATRASYDIQMPIAYFEASLTALWDIKQNLISNGKLTKKYNQISKYNPLQKDMAFIAKKKIGYHQLATAIQETSEAIEEVNLFDYFENEKLGVENASYAFRIKIRQDDKSWDDTEINTLMNLISQKLNHTFDATLRN